MAEKSQRRPSRGKSIGFLCQTILESREDTFSDDIPDIDLDNPVNFESRQPYKSPGTPTIDVELQRETRDLVISTYNESSSQSSNDNLEMNNNHSASNGYVNLSIY